MKKFTTQAAQGDVLFQRIGDVADLGLLPEGARQVAAETELLVIAHSETGHHHVMEAERVDMYRLPEEIYECFVVVKEPAALTHLRPFDTHEPIEFQPGIYRVRRQREYTPQGMHLVAD
jgi:hypothetical protein